MRKSLSNTELCRSIRAGLALGMAGLVGTSTAAFAQADQDDARTLDRVEVVGSRIKRVEAETNQPIFTLEREDIQAQGLTSIGDVLQNLSQNGATLNSTFNNGGNGETRVDLRNLGDNRTLVLVNGRRWAPGTGLGGAVDLNTIPISTVERIEVLKDGASAIYGSDAIAGVVNVILRNDFDGAEAHAYWGEYDEGDGRRQAYDFTIGTGNDRSNVMMNASYVKEDPVMAGARDISRETVYGAGIASGSTVSPTGILCIPSDPFCDEGLYTFDPDGSGFASPDDFRFFTPEDAYNTAPDNYLLTPQERTAIFMRGHYDIFDNLRFVGQAVYNERKSEQLLAAMPVSLGILGGNSVTISPDSVYNPFGEEIIGAARRFSESGGRRFTQDVNTFAFTGAFEGDFMLGDLFWAWDVGYTYAENDQVDQTFGLFNLTNLQNALGPSFFDDAGVAVCGTPDSPIAGCVPLNLFGGLGTITPEMLAYTSFTAQDTFGYKMTNYFANVSGELFNLPGGMAAIAFGYEYRRESGFDQPDAIIATGNTTGNARTPTSGGYNVDEFYTELALPLLADVPFARELELKVAGRYSDYSTFGDTTNLTAGFKWRPFEDLALRGNYGEGFRAPAIGELFQGQSDSFVQLFDPCAATIAGNPGPYSQLSAQQQERCHSLGVPVGGYNQVNQQIRITVGGNPDLQPETSTSKTLGFVYSPNWFEGFDVSLDWWNIEIENTITTLSGQFLTDGCILGGNDAFCAQITRGPNGSITDLLAAGVNVGIYEVEGWDLTLRYNFDTDWGRFGVVWDNTYFSKYDQTFPTGESDEAGNPIFETDSIVGEYSQFFPRWRIRSNLNLRWNLGDYGVNWGVRYYHHLDESCAIGLVFPDTVLPNCSDPERMTENGLEPENKLGSTTYHDARFSWNSPWNATVSLGINNILDKDPPIAYSAFANSFDPQYDLPGRFWYAEYTQRF